MPAVWDEHRLSADGLVKKSACEPLVWRLNFQQPSFKVQGLVDRRKEGRSEHQALLQDGPWICEIQWRDW